MGKIDSTDGRVNTEVVEISGHTLLSSITGWLKRTFAPAPLPEAALREMVSRAT